MYARSDSTGKATLNITGSGSLDASGSSNGILVQSNSGDATLTIQNADVTAENSSYSGDGVTVRAGSSSSASLSVDGGSLTATGTGVGSGINFQFGNGDSGTGTPAVTVSGNAIVRANGGISDNSSKDIQIGDGDDSSGGIVFDGDEGTVYGSVELQENLTIGEGESLTLANGASLNANNHNVIVDGGTLDSTLATSLGDSVKYTPTITTTSPLSNGTVGTYYSQTLTATGTGDITWSLAEGQFFACRFELERKHRRNLRHPLRGGHIQVHRDGRKRLWLRQQGVEHYHQPGYSFHHHPAQQPKRDRGQPCRL